MILKWALTALVLARTGIQVEVRVYQDLKDLPKNVEPFDFIIAGGGTAGCVLASRLSENRRFRVLLIEAGPDNAGEETLIVPAWGYRINATKHNWNYVSEPLPGLNGRTTPVPRGRVLGGSSSINGMVYTRGSADDFDNWGRVTGDHRWSWKALWPYIERHERWLPPAGGRKPSDEHDPKVHGYSGNVGVSLPWGEHNEHDIRTLKNAELQKEFPIILDINAGRPIGIAWMQSTIGNGERSSSAVSYLGPKVRERPNLSILLSTQVTRVLPSTRTARIPDIRTVEFAAHEGGETRTLTATKELVLAAGVIGSPQILLHSGIGNKTELNTLGITSVVDNPDVGEGLTEHAAANVQWNVIAPAAPPIDQATAEAMWRQNRTGPLTELFKHQMLWYRFPNNSTLLKQFKDPSTGPTSPHLEMPLDAPANAYICLLTPQSRGTLKLRSKNPFDRPIIDLNLLSHPFDLAAFKEGVRAMKRFYSGPAWDGYLAGFRGPDPDVLSDKEFEKVVRDNAITFLHPVGGAAMSSKTSKTGVVDGELRVKGTTGLRVVDASVFPYVLTAHTQAGVYILAERASDIIRESW